LSFGLFVLPLSAENAVQVAPVSQFDLKRFTGTWYELARLPTKFEKGLTRVTATYTLRPDGKIDVLNQGYKDGKATAANATAWIADEKNPAHLFIAFFLVFGSDYKVFELDTEDYSWALTSSGQADSLWLLSRTPSVSPELLQQLLDKARSHGFKVDQLEIVDHS
jgi:lipocalin